MTEATQEIAPFSIQELRDKMIAPYAQALIEILTLEKNNANQQRLIDEMKVNEAVLLAENERLNALIADLEAENTIPQSSKSKKNNRYQGASISASDSDSERQPLLYQGLPFIDHLTNW
jgi:hypothetical protein